MIVELRDFDRNDWMANAGAEPADGRTPQIGSDDERGIEARFYSRTGSW